MKTELKLTDQIDKLLQSAVLSQYHFYLSRGIAVNGINGGGTLDDAIFQCQLKFFQTSAALHLFLTGPAQLGFFHPQDLVFCTSSTGTLYFHSHIISIQEQTIILYYPKLVSVQYLRAFPRFFCLDKRINLQFTFSDLHFQGLVEDISQHGARVSFHHQLDIRELQQKEYIQIRSIGELVLVPTLKAQIAYLTSTGNQITACGLFIENDYPFLDIKEFFNLQEK